MKLSQPKYTGTQSTLINVQNFKKDLQNTYFGINRIFPKSQSQFHQMQIQPIKHSTSIEISNLGDNVYQCQNFIKSNNQPTDYEGRDGFWSEIDLSSISKKSSDNIRTEFDKSYTFYNQNRSSVNESISENKKRKQFESKIKMENYSTNIKKEISHTHLSYEDLRNISYNSLSNVNCQIKNSISEFTSKKEEADILATELQTEKLHKNSFIENSNKLQSESKLEICSSEKNISLEEHSGLVNVSMENCENVCKIAVNEIYKSSCTDQTNNLIKSCEQYDFTLFTSDSNEYLKDNKQTNNIKPKFMNNKPVNLKETGTYNSNMDQGRIQLESERCLTNIDSNKNSATYSSNVNFTEKLNLSKGDAEWIDVVESELINILESNSISRTKDSNLSDSISSLTPPLPPLTPTNHLRESENKITTGLHHADKLYCEDYIRNLETRNSHNLFKKLNVSNYKKQIINNYNDGIETGDLTSTTTGLDLDSMLDRSDSDLSANDARNIKKQLDGLEHMYTEVLKLLGNNSKQRVKKRSLVNYGSVSSLPSSSVSSRPVTRHYDKKKSYSIDDRLKKTKDIKNIYKRFQRLESHVVTLARSVAHLSSEMRTQHLIIQEMENIRSEISSLRTQTNMAIIKSQSQPIIKDSDLPALSNPTRVKKLTKFFGTEPPLIRLFLRELGYEKHPDKLPAYKAHKIAKRAKLDSVQRNINRRVTCRFDQNTFEKNVAHCVLDNMLPNTVVESDSFRKIFDDLKLKIGNIPLKHLSRYTISKHADEAYYSQTKEIKSALESAKYVCSTADIWSSAKRSFMGVTVHWIDEKTLIRKSAALACRRFAGSHTYENIKNIIEEIHTKYGLNNVKVIGTVTDNGSNFVKAFKEFGLDDAAFFFEDDLEHIGSSYENAEDEDEEMPVLEQDIDYIDDAIAEDIFENNSILSRHFRCATHTLNLLSTTDTNKIIKQEYDLNIAHNTVIGKCQEVWSSLRSTQKRENLTKFLGKSL